MASAKVLRREHVWCVPTARPPCLRWRGAGVGAPSQRGRRVGMGSQGHCEDRRDGEAAKGF